MTKVVTVAKFPFDHEVFTATWALGAGLEEVVRGDHADHGAVLGGARVAGPPRGHVVDDGQPGAAARRGAHALRREEQFRPVVVVAGSESAAAEERKKRRRPSGRCKIAKPT